MSRGAWICPPECQGQIVIVEYADTYDGLVWRRIYDQSDRTEIISVADANDPGDDADFDPWNGEPQGYEWERSTRRAFDLAVES